MNLIKLVIALLLNKEIEITHYIRTDMECMQFSKEEFTKLCNAGEVRNELSWTPVHKIGKITFAVSK